MSSSGLSAISMTGRVVLIVDGSDFGTVSVAVTVMIGSHACVVVTLREQQIKCAASVPVCVGNVVVTVAGRSSAATSVAQYDYDVLAEPVVITGVYPLTGPGIGGTAVVISVTNVGAEPDVAFRELSPARLFTGRTFPCEWRGVDGMGVNTSAIVCRAPPLTSAGPYFAVFVTVVGVSSRYQFGVWEYERPMVRFVAVPGGHALPPVPPNDSSSVLAITGANFGTVTGHVLVEGRDAVVTSWSNEAVFVVAPVNVAALASVVVVTAGTVTSLASASATVSYSPPVVLSISVNSSSTAGGGMLVVTGANFAVLARPVSVWLVRNDALLSAPWPSLGDPLAVRRDALQCGLVNQSRVVRSSASVTCVVPRGNGFGWHVVVVNHDTDLVTGLVSQSKWRTSAPAGAFSYEAPVVTSIVVDGAKPAVGGFNVRLTGANFLGSSLYVLRFLGGVSLAACMAW